MRKKALQRDRKETKKEPLNEKISIFLIDADLLHRWRDCQAGTAGVSGGGDGLLSSVFRSVVGRQKKPGNKFLIDRWNKETNLFNSQNKLNLID